MSKIITILLREFRESVFKKGFIISTLLTPVLMLSAIFLPAILSDVDTGDRYKIDVVDRAGFVFDELDSRLDAKNKDGSRRFQFTDYSHDDHSREQMVETLKARINRGSSDGFLYIPESIEDSAKMEYYTKNVSNFDLNRTLRTAVNDVVTEKRIKRSGLDPEMIKQLTRRIELVTVKIKEGEEEKESGFIEEYFVTLAFVMILYVTLLLYGASIMRGVLEEKNSRVVEVLLSSASSFQLMVGKIVGLGSVGLAQYLIWCILGISFSLYGGSLTGLPIGDLSFDPSIFLYFVLFFILGYFLFSTLYAAFGAISNTDQEAQQASFPIVILLIIPLIMMTFIVKNPQSTVSVIMSIIPFFSPILMFARINTASPTPLEIWGSIFLLVLTIIGSMWLVARIYRIGILSYGKKPTLAELMRWIRTK